MWGRGRCSGDDKMSYLFHNYRPMTEKLEDVMESIVQEYVDKEGVVVSTANSVDRYIRLRGSPLCRDQFLRLVAVALCVNAKYWDEGAAASLQNVRIAGRVGVPLEDFNRMEIAFLRGLQWTLSVSTLNFAEWRDHLGSLAKEASDESLLEMEQRNESPLLSTDVAEGIVHATIPAHATGARESPPPKHLAGVHVCSSDDEPKEMRVSSSAKDSKGDVITTRLVFAALPEHGASRATSCHTDTILRIGSTDGLGGGETILRSYSTTHILN